MTKTLDAREGVFVGEYLIDLDPKRAALKAGYSATMAASKAYQWVSDGKAKPHVYAAIQAALEKRSARTEITADRVLQELWAIATADPNDIVQFRRGPCPSCHGGDQTETVPDCACIECRGEGRGRAFVTDTRELTGAARKLYAGVRVTKDGFEVKMHDKAAALVNVGRHLGMFLDKTEHSGNVNIIAQPQDDRI